MIKVLRPKVAIPLLVALMSLNGCTWGSGGRKAEVPEMHRNFSRTVDIQTGVIEGDLERSRSAASWLIGREGPTSFPTGAQGYEEEMLGTAALIAEAEELETVATQAGRLAAACGSCHKALNGGPRFVVGSRAPGGETQEAHMVRHIWATDRMWEGLVGPSENAWLAGAQALAQTEPTLSQAFRASMAPAELEGLLREVNALATEALIATGQNERADLYGRILSTCNRCHASAGSLAKR
jgi:cytochrome c553